MLRLFGLTGPVALVGFILGADPGLPTFAQYGLLAPLLGLIVAAWWRAEKRADRLEARLLEQTGLVLPALEAARRGLDSAGHLAESLVEETRSVRDLRRDIERALETGRR